MAGIHVSNPETVADYLAAMAAAGVTLPLDLDPNDPGSIIDATGMEVCGMVGALSDEECEARAMWIICAVNTCGGFRAEKADG